MVQTNDNNCDYISNQHFHLSIYKNKSLTIRNRRNLYGVLNFFLGRYTLHSTQPQATTAKERRAPRDELLVAQPKFNIICAALLKIRHNRTRVNGSQTEK